MGTCFWQTGRWGQFLHCPQGYIGMGACGSGRNADCRKHGVSAWTELMCCQIRCDRRTSRTYCHDRSASWGRLNSCSSEKAVFSLCGSGENADCGHHTWTKIKCCKENAISLQSRTCNWQYGGYGSYLNCGSGYVLSGVCGSGRNADCPRRSFHGIRCCRYTTSSVS